jgi:cell division septal protein FtsQ
MTVVGSKSGLHSPEFHKKKRRERQIKLAILAIILIIIVAVPIYLARTSHFRITHIEVSGNEVTKSEEIEGVVSRDLSGDYALIFPRDNTALFPKKKIVSDLMSGIPRLSSVTITRQGTKGIVVTVTERAPEAEYCTDTTDPSDPKDCYFIDVSGYIFSPAPAFSGNVYLTYTNDTPLTSPIGQTVLPAGTFLAMNNFIASLGSLNVYPRVVDITTDEYHALLANGTEIMWNKSANLDTVRENFAAFLSDKSIATQEDFLSRVLYVDLRFDNKVFYKYRE